MSIKNVCFTALTIIFVIACTQSPTPQATNRVDDGSTNATSGANSQTSSSLEEIIVTGQKSVSDADVVSAFPAIGKTTKISTTTRLNSSPPIRFQLLA